MRVSLQNHQIGFRNVHRIPEGAARNVGGGFSNYLIFLVRVPASIGEIRNVDGSYMFTPLRAEMFPGLGGPVAGLPRQGNPVRRTAGQGDEPSFPGMGVAAG